ncbi:hypothetical protein HAZT_HAZT010812 [Hyalella azteca]|uniref:Ion transport domain-containing protein n=1 Tax=Hyalella azteca TaxID=294128 RepID=A0A6A0H3L4_HYAAZ|nr:hypothetical protein HAZT_HAZT010812 [Hyalella azteca]
MSPSSGIITSRRISLSGSHLNSGLQSPPPTSEVLRSTSVSRQSLLDIVSSKISVGSRKRFSRDSFSSSYVNRTRIASETDESRRTRDARRKDIRSRFKSDKTERHTNSPNLFRSIILIHYLLVTFHWNACVFYIIAKKTDCDSIFHLWISEPNSTSPNETHPHPASHHNTTHVVNADNDVMLAYLKSFYWCTLALTTIGDLRKPESKCGYIFQNFELMFGLLLFATVLGHVANIVTNVSAARKEFQGAFLEKFFSVTASVSHYLGSSY